MYVCGLKKMYIHLSCIKDLRKAQEKLNNSCSGNGVRKLNRGLGDIFFTPYILDLICFWGHESIYNK